MFRCNDCKTEYGGIRGIVAERCPRCEAESASPAISIRRTAEGELRGHKLSRWAVSSSHPS
jgi:hypothetical protein